MTSLHVSMSEEYDFAVYSKIISGCGGNSYGSDCKGVCSIRADKMCRGIFICTSYGCTCPAGLTGSLCNKGN